MANIKLFCLFLASFLLRHDVSCAGHSPVIDPVNRQGKNWCVVSPFTPPTSKLQAFINSACGEVDCKEIRSGGSCYEPNTLENHASFVLNLVYRARGTCDSGIGNLVITDPSYAKCRYP